MTGGALNLSLLSRGVGEVQKNGHEKVEVFLEPEDYHNFSKNTEKFYLPPIHSSYPTFIDGSPNLTTRSSREAMEFRVPKTFTTRKGALLLFSEDLAQRNMERAAAAAAAAKRQNTHHSFDNALTPAHSFDAQLNLKTVEDLANSILKYGSHNRVEDKMFLKFIHARQENFDRQIRPGYSAKRYLSTWTRTWDDRVFDNVIKHGYINERSLYQYNLLAPHLRRRLFTEDLSHMPQPYRLMRNMLMTPGSLSGYTFYRAPTQHALDEEDQTDYETFTLKKRPTDRLKHIRVIKTQGGIQEEVAYSDLDRESQKEVITDLLVKSAVHYALKKQEEMYEESIIMAVKSEQTAGQTGGLVERKAVEFDMNEAVDSLLDTPHGGFAITADLPDADRKSQGSDLTGSFKGAPVPPHAVRQHQSTHRALPALEHTDKEYFGGVPVVAVRDGSTASDSSSVRSHPSNVPQLPPIRHTLSPIRDVSRETTQQNLSLPPIAKALLEEEEFDTDTEGDRKSRKKTDMSVTSLQSTVKTKGQSSEGPAVHSSHDSIQAPASGISGTSKTRPNWRSRKGTNSGVDSIKGSMVLAPDGEIISVGGSVVRGGAGHDVGNINDLMIGRHEGAVTDESGVSDEEPDEWRGGTQKKHSIFSHKSEGSKRPQKRGSATTTASSVSKEDIEKLSTTGKQILLDQASRVSGSVSQRSSVTEKDIMDTLTDHAQRIAESVLSQPDAGRDLERDVKDAIAEIMKNRRASSAAPTAAEYRDLIKKSLAVAAAKAAGIDPDSISDDAEISPQLLEALASQKLTPEQIEIVSDGEGRTVIQSRVDLAESMGGVEEGHLYIAPGKKGEDSTLSKRQVSIPADRASVVDDMEFDRISYQGTDVMSEKGEKGKGPKSKTGSIAGGTMADLTEVEGVMAQIENKVEDSPDQDDDFVKAVEEAQGVTGAETVKTSPPSTVKAPTSGITTPSGEDRSVPPASAGEATLPERSEVAELPDQGFVADKKPEDAQSVKSGKTGVSQKSEASKDSKARSKKSKSPEEKEEPFVVGKPKDKKPKKEPKVPKKEEEKKPKKGKKGKKGKKKEEEPEPAPAEEPTVEAEEPAPQPPALESVIEPTPRKSPTPSEPKPSSPEYKTEEESDTEFNFVREASSPELDPIPQTRLQLPSPPLDDEEDENDDQEDNMSPDEGEESNLKSISNREARAAKRAAAAAKRREEVEKRRREKEEQAKREKEEVERQVALQREMEEERRRREEERRMRKEQQKLAEEKELQEQEEQARRKKLDAERERKAKEEYQRKLEEMKRKQHEEEMRRHELMLQKQKEEEERRLEEEAMLSQMAEQERIEYERKKREEEEERKRKAEEERLKREEEARKAMEEARRLAEEMARKQAELEARLKFNKDLQVESVNLTHAHEINRAFVFSYYELLQWLGLDIPEFELAKLADY